MSDGSPTRDLLRTVNGAARTWVRETRARRQNGRMGRRSTAAAAVVTLAAGMAAAPATAAVAPGDDGQPGTNATASEGVQVAGRMRTAPRPNQRPFGEREAPPYGRHQPAPPQRPRPGPLDPATQRQFDEMDRARDPYSQAEGRREWTETMQKELQNELDKQRREAETFREPEPPAVAPGDPLTPPLLDQKQIDALNQRMEAAEPPGYVNQYRDDALTLSPDSDKANVDREISRSYLNSEDATEHNKPMLDGFRQRMHQAIDDKHTARSPEARQEAIDRYNQAAREFNEAELAERDAFGGHPPDRRVTPKSLDDPAPTDDQPAPVGAVEQGLPPERTPSPRSLAQNDPNFDNPPDSLADQSDTDTQMNSPRSQAQHDPSYDSPTGMDTDTQMDSPRSQAQDDPGYDSPVGVDTESDSPAPDAPGTDPGTDPAQSPDAAPVASASDESTSGYGTESESAGTESAGGDGADTVTGFSGDDSLGSFSGTDSLGTSESVGDSMGSDTSSGFGSSDTSGMSSDSSGMSSDSGGMSGDSSSGMSGDSGSGMSGDSSSGMSGDSGSGMGGDSSGGMGGDSGGMGGMSSSSGF